MKKKIMYGAFALLGVLLYTSCDKENPVENSGEKVTVRFSVNENAYGSGSTPARSMEMGAVKQETVNVPLNNDFYLEATLSAVAESPATRAPGDPKNLDAGTKVRIVAYDGNGNRQDYVDYTIGADGDHNPSGVALEMKVTPGRYTFVAYSHNSTGSLPEHKEKFENIDPATDIMLGSVKNVDVDGNGASYQIRLTHQFSQIEAFNVTASDAFDQTQLKITNISGITLSGARQMHLTVFDGTRSNGDAPTTHAFNKPWTVANGNATVTEYQERAYVGGPFTFTIGSITMEDRNSFSVTYPNAILQDAIVVPFTTGLAAGTSYTLSLTLKKTIKFASSNIYWDKDYYGPNNGALTFDLYSPTPPLSSMQKQGVHFKWGSLIGVSAASLFAGGHETSWNNDIIYVPTNGASFPRTWSAMTAATAMSMYHFSAWGYDPAVDSLYMAIPFVDDAYIPGTDVRTNSYLTTLTYGDDFKGDICQYINNDYRMPTSLEFGELEQYTGVESLPSSGYLLDEIVTSGDGLTQILKSEGRGLTYTPVGGNMSWFFPCSGNRASYLWSNIGLRLVRVGADGLYWTSSMSNLGWPYDPDFPEAVSLWFCSLRMETKFSDSRGGGYAVRCVLK